MESDIDDKEFVKKARELINMVKLEAKEALFVDLVKETFFGVFFDGLSEIELFMKDKGDRKFIFEKNKFLKTQGFCKKCNNSEF